METDVLTDRVWNKYLTGRDQAVFSQSGFGARAGFGERPALLVIDVNYAFCDEGPRPILESMKRWPSSCGEYAWNAMPFLERVIGGCRSKGVPIIYTTGSFRDDGWDAGSWRWKFAGLDTATRDSEKSLDGNKIVLQIAPHAKDIVLEKQKPSAFFGTNLASYLTLLRCDSVIVIGTTTSGCVRATVTDAFSLNYRVTVVEEACFDRSEASHAVNLLDMHAKYADVVGVGEALEFISNLPAQMYDLPQGRPMD